MSTMPAVAAPLAFRPPPGLEDAVPAAHVCSMLGIRPPPGKFSGRSLLQVPFAPVEHASSRSTSPGAGLELASSSSDAEEEERCPLSSPWKVQLQLAEALESAPVAPPPASPVLRLSDLLLGGAPQSTTAMPHPSPLTDISVGSAGHEQGLCKPCAFFHTKGCSNGAACTHCHLCLPGEKRRRRTVRKEAVAARKRGERQ